MTVLTPNANVEQSQRTRCWSCLAEMEADAQFCPKCGKLQPTTPGDYFSFFGLPRRFVLDRGSIEKQFYRLSRKLHPDLYARATPQEQQWSLERSSVLNDAWRTLRDPIRRTEYLLALEGIRLEEQSRDATDMATASGTAKQQVVPPDLLEEVFELNMQLEGMRMAHSSGTDDPELKENLEAAKRSFDAQMADAERKLQNLWGEWDTAAEARDASAQKAGLQKIVDLLNRRSYIRNLVRDVREALGDSEPVMTAPPKEDKAG